MRKLSYKTVFCIFPPSSHSLFRWYCVKSPGQSWSSEHCLLVNSFNGSFWEKIVNPVFKKFRFICLGKFLGQERKKQVFWGENISPQLVFLWGMFHLKLSTRSIQVSCYHRAYRLSLMLWWFGTKEEGPAQRSLSSWAQCTRCMYFCRHCIHFTSSKSTSKHPLLIFS